MLEVEAEQAIIDLDVFDRVLVASHIKARIIGVMRVAGAGQMQAAQNRVAGIQHHDRASVSRINRHFATAIDGQRFVDDDRAGIVARWRLEYRTGGRTVYQVLKRFEAMNALVALVQHKSWLGAVNIGAGTHTGGYFGLLLAFATGEHQEKRSGQAQPGQMM